MPMTFQDREQGFEAKFAHDEERRFLTTARRDKLFAQWAANTLHLSDEAAKAMLHDVLSIQDGPDHDRALLRYMADFMSARGAGLPESDLSAVLGRCMQQALLQVGGLPSDPL
jgi:hypothetical protein